MRSATNSDTNVMGVPFERCESLDHADINNLEILDKVSEDKDPGWDSGALTVQDVSDFLDAELCTPILDDLYSHLHLFARRAWNSVDPLHYHAIKGRQIVPSEDSKLHLVWTEDRIFLKPLPRCLLNYEFWQHYLLRKTSSPCKPGIQAVASTNSYCPHALGLLRTYALLIRHRTDFIIAKEKHLLPVECEWSQWSRFLSRFRHLDDTVVSKRYHYGQLRLSRLNWAVRLFRPKSSPTFWFYELPYWSTMPYVRDATVPLVFLFASLSLVLSSMSLIRASLVDELDDRWHATNTTFRGFAAMIVLLSVISWVLLLGIPAVVLLWQLSWGLSQTRPASRPSKITTEV